jgi:hypothetical protein
MFKSSHRLELGENLLALLLFKYVCGAEAVEVVVALLQLALIKH